MRAVAENYADALADVALSQNAAEDVGRELADFLALMQESPELGVLLRSPAVARTNKHAVVEKLAAQMGAGRTLRNFLFVVINQRRVALLPEIQAAFRAQLYERRGITRADVASARELNDAQKEQLQKTLERISGRRIEAQYRLEPALIAGTVVRVGSTIYDGSVRTQLERLRARLASP
jgi:F-type H+-transporting ATPase subunit delta